MFIAGLRASDTLFKRGWHAVLRSKVSWHDKTPVSVMTRPAFVAERLRVAESSAVFQKVRPLSRILTKDVEAMDDRLAGSWEHFLS